jgi:hypothetical protein
MEVEVLNMISEASINGYYEPSLGLVVVWFHNMKEDKPDLVAYLMHGMNWDLREVTEEKSTLEVDREIIEIIHKPIEVFAKDSSFDQTIRKVLNQVIEHSLKESEEQSPRLEMMKIVLDSNSYHTVRN